MRTYKLMRFVFATAVFSPIMLAGATNVSKAADTPRPPAYPMPPPPLFYNWTGIYAGVHVGGGWADLGVGDTGTGFIGGGQVGFNYQINQWVWGLEAESQGRA
jgi:outer membrane immunogenic protein